MKRKLGSDNDAGGSGGGAASAGAISAPSSNARYDSEEDAVRSKLNRTAEHKEHDVTVEDVDDGEEDDDSNEEYGASALPGNNSSSTYMDVRRKCPYLDTVNRQKLDFDQQKVCSVTLTNLNVYACLVCGKYFAGR
jgi:U4/U6.U5 tri-snRNP-associated protein 2